MVKLTFEQADIEDAIVINDQENNYGAITLVHAGAGTGKSFMAVRIVETLQPSTGLYTAFNRAIVEECRQKLKNTKMMCKTFHALALKYVDIEKEISDISYKCIKENILFGDKYKVISAINDFFVSDKVDMYEFFNDYFLKDETCSNKKELIKICGKYVEKMLGGEINPTFNFLLKAFHVMLYNGELDCEFDLVILDEINDVTAVSLEIFKLIKAKQKIGLGETHQAIYKFLNLVDGFKMLPEAETFYLTNSFRCSKKIASTIERFMQKELTASFKFSGTDDPVANGKTLYCTNTNAKIIDHIVTRLRENKGFSLLRKISEIFALPLAMLSAAKGKKPYQKKYSYLLDQYTDWLENREKGQGFLSYLYAGIAQTDPEIKTAVNMLLKFSKNNINLYQIYSDAKNAEVDPNYVIATVYTSKGLEFETVYVAEDLDAAIQNIRDNGGPKTEKDVVIYRCYYVACSRAGKNLYASCLANYW